MKIPKCRKTISGKHNWSKGRWSLSIAGDEIHGIVARDILYWDKTIKCCYCGLIDDRKLNNHY